MMDRIKQLIRSPPGILGTFMLGTICFVGTYKMLIRPELKRRSRAEANEYAEFLFRKEMAAKEGQTDVQS